LGEVQQGVHLCLTGKRKKSNPPLFVVRRGGKGPERDNGVRIKAELSPHGKEPGGFFQQILNREPYRRLVFRPGVGKGKGARKNCLRGIELPSRVEEMKEI